MIAHTINTARSSGLFDDIIVSTDDAEIADVARSSGASVPFERPSHLTDDHTPIVPVMRHAIDWFETNVGQIEWACCLFATAPFLRAEDLRTGLRKLENNAEADFAIGVTTYVFPIQRAFAVEGGWLRLMWPEHELTRSQDLEEALHDAGQFYWGSPQAFRSSDWIISRTVPVHIPRHLVQDIDTEEDWVRAEMMKQVIDRELKTDDTVGA